MTASSVASVARRSLPRPLPRSRPWAAALVWAAAWLAMLVLDGRLDLSNLALLQVLAAALAALWWPPRLSMPAAALSVLGFNWAFVPPRHAFSVDLQQHALLLAAMLAVSWIMALLVARQAQAAQRARRHARDAEELRRFGDVLRDADHPVAVAPAMRDALCELCDAPVALYIARPRSDGVEAAEAAEYFGEPDADQRAGLHLCVQQGQALGPGTGRHEDQPCWYLPMRGRAATFGAAVIGFDSFQRPVVEDRIQAQAICDQFGQAIERAEAVATAALARDEARAQALRNTLLSAVAHDFRTPLATMLGAASSLLEQGERLGMAQRDRLATTIADEARRLTRLADNTLQLARLEGGRITLRLDWESAEELVGTVLRQLRPRDPTRRVRARVEPPLPLLRCDAILLVQMLDNLLDNALRYSGADAPVELLVRRVGDAVMFAVRDRGPGIEPAWRERIFQRFERGRGAADAARGAGVGLALARAIAEAHQGRLRQRPRGHGGSAFECYLPIVEAPS